MAPASETFFRIPELVHCLADQIQNRKQLASLRLVNKAISAAATASLFRELRITVVDLSRLLSVVPKEYKPTILYPGPLNNTGAITTNGQSPIPLHYLRHVRFLEIRRYPQNASCGVERADVLQQLLATGHLANLERFAWIDMPWTTDASRALLDACKKLKALRLEFPGGPASTSGHPWTYVVPDPIPDISMFRGLEELVIIGIYVRQRSPGQPNVKGSLKLWARSIAAVLRASSRSLRRLELAFGTGLTYPTKLEDQAYFFVKLSEAYHHHRRRLGNDNGDHHGNDDDDDDDDDDDTSRTGDSEQQLRLRLASLRCSSALTPSTLHQLADLTLLESLHVDNGDKPTNSFQAPDFSRLDVKPFDWEDVLGPACTPRLRRISTTFYTADLHAFLLSLGRTSPGFARRLTVTSEKDSGAMMRDLYQPFGGRKKSQGWWHPPALRMVDLDVNQEHRTADFELDTFMRDARPEEEPLDYAQDFDDRALENLVRVDSEYGPRAPLEGLSVHRFDLITEMIDKRRQWPELAILARVLPRLVNLEGLHLPMHEASERRLTLDGALRAAKVLAASSGPRLRYVRIGSRCWRIWRNNSTDAQDNNTVTTLEMLHQSEWRGIECINFSIFAPCIFDPDSFLPACRVELDIDYFNDSNGQLV